MTNFYLKLEAKPVSINHAFGHRAFKKGAMIKYKTKENKALQELIKSKVPVHFPVFNGEVEVVINFYFENNRKHDLDDYPKVILDALNGLVYYDDNQIVKLTLKKYKINTKVTYFEIYAWELTDPKTIKYPFCELTAKVKEDTKP